MTSKTEAVLHELVVALPVLVLATAIFLGAIVGALFGALQDVWEDWGDDAEQGQQGDERSKEAL